MKAKLLTLIAVVFVILASSTVVLAADITYDGINYISINADADLEITVNYAASNYAEGEHVTLMVLTGSDTVTYTDSVPNNIAYVDQHEITADSGSFTFILAKDFITDNQVFVKLGSTTMASSDNTTATVITEGSVNFIDANGIVESFISGCDGNYAVANTDVVFTINKGTLATNIRYKANGDDYVVLEPVDGIYTIPASAITGDIELVADVVGEGISVELTSNVNYKPVVTEMIEKQLCIIEGTSPTDSYTVDGVQLYWSPLYNGHAGFISSAKSLENLEINEVAVQEGVAPTQVVYNGDINGNGRATAADATIIKDCLLGKRTLPMTDIQLLKLDADGDGRVTTFDIVAVLNKAVGK